MTVFGIGVRDQAGNSFQWSSVMTSTVPSVTLMAVSSSIAYAAPHPTQTGCGFRLGRFLLSPAQLG